MTNALITIYTQFQENYSDTTTPRWKNKGGREFKVTINSDLLMHGTSDIALHLKALIALECNEHFNYIYNGHDIAFSEPEILDSALLETLVRKEYADNFPTEEEQEELQGKVSHYCDYCDEVVKDTNRSYCSDQCEDAEESFK
jgi:hypothetical protein